MSDHCPKPTREHQQRIIEAAVDYVKRHKWVVFLAPPNGDKRGLCSQKDNGERWGAVRTVNDAREVFGVEYLQKRFRLSRCNVGIATGVESNLVVLDIDTQAAHGKDGLASLRQLEKLHGKLPRTLTAITPSGGLQMFFRHPGDDVYIPCSASKVAEGIDVKADGGMVIGPPSWRRGVGFYEWDRKRGDKVAEMPDWLVALVTADARKRRGPKNTFELFADLELRGSASIAELTIALSLIPNRDVDWESWNRMGMAVHAATGGSSDGLRLFDGWSQKSSKYDPSATAEKWDALNGCTPNEIGAGSIFFMAEEAVPGWRDQLREPEVRAGVVEFCRLMRQS